jgi:RimJ/RimL family protein N-acetyltransferase
MTDVRLERFPAELALALDELIQDPDVQRFTSVPQPPPPGYAAEWFARYEQGRRDGTREAFAILDAQGTVLGVGVALAIDRPGRTVELGYAISPSARGRGVATEALRQLTAWALSDLGVLRVELRINVDNEASKRVAERCGYVREGVLRSMPLKDGAWGDLEVWSRLATDP